jgi:hypothetical protein
MPGIAAAMLPGTTLMTMQSNTEISSVLWEFGLFGC